MARRKRKIPAGTVPPAGRPHSRSTARAPNHCLAMTGLPPLSAPGGRSSLHRQTEKRGPRTCSREDTIIDSIFYPGAPFPLFSSRLPASNPAKASVFSWTSVSFGHIAGHPSPTSSSRTAVGLSSRPLLAALNAGPEI